MSLTESEEETDDDDEKPSGLLGLEKNILITVKRRSC